MKLLVDIGNSRVTWTLAEAASLAPARRCAHGDCADEWRALTPRPGEAFVCSVAPAAVTEQVLAQLPAIACQRVTTASTWPPAGLVNGYRDPGGLGVDRWLALIAARTAFAPAPIVIADAGTALTLDYVDAGGQHRGGAILAGSGLQRAALAARAPTLPATGGDAVLPGRSTVDALAGGALYGVAGAVERIAADLAADGPEPVRLLTGGEAESVQPLLAADWRLDPLLVLRGLLLAGESGCAGSH